MIVRWFLAAEVAIFGIAVLIHAGVLLRGYEHAAARNAESVIALVLALGLVATLLAPARTRAIGVGAQAFALLGTFVGLFTIAIGVGPRTAFDLLIHGTMIVLLVIGLIAARRVSYAR